MTQHNYFGMAASENLKTRPQDFIVDPEELNRMINETTKKAQALHKLNDTSKPVDLRKEYNNLRKQLYDLQHATKNTEIFCNNVAGTVKQLEERITSLLRLKKKADEAGELGQARMLEHQIVSLETELVDAKIEFTQAKTRSGNAARALKGFTGHEAIAELKKKLAL
jgi:hypothetical protein